jgi:hypothetical protein
MSVLIDRTKLLIEINRYNNMGIRPFYDFNSKVNEQELELQLAILKETYRRSLIDEIQRYIDAQYISSPFERRFIENKNVLDEKELIDIINYYSRCANDIKQQINLIKLYAIGSQALVSIIDDKYKNKENTNELNSDFNNITKLIDLGSKLISELPDNELYRFCTGTKQHEIFKKNSILVGSPHSKI